MPKKKVGQFEDYKKWTTDQGYTFFAKDKADAELYVQKTSGDLGKVREVTNVKNGWTFITRSKKYDKAYFWRCIFY